MATKTKSDNDSPPPSSFMQSKRHILLQSKEETLRRSLGVDESDFHLPLTGLLTHNKEIAIHVDDPRKGGSMVEKTLNFAYVIM